MYNYFVSYIRIEDNSHSYGNCHIIREKPWGTLSHIKVGDTITEDRYNNEGVLVILNFQLVEELGD